MNHLYRLQRWELKKHPLPHQVEKLLQECGVNQLAQEQYAAGQKTEERMEQASVVYGLLWGQCQVSFPGYGVVALNAGDLIEILAEVRYDLSPTGVEPCIWLQGKITTVALPMPAPNR